MAVGKKLIIVLLVLLTWVMRVWCAEIHDAAASGNLQKVTLLIEKDPGVVATQNKNDQTPLHIAAAKGHTEVCKLLLLNGAELEACDKYGATPLFWAALYGEKLVVEELLANGAEINAREKTGMIPLHYAAWRGHKDILSVLLAQGGDPNAKDRKGWTPLHKAASENKKEAASILLYRGAKINTPEEKGHTPLHMAAHKGNREVLEFLLANGADAQAKDQEGRTPLDLAALGQHEQIVNILRRSRTEEAAVAGPGSAPDTPPDPSQHYKWKSKWMLPFGAEGVIVKDVKGKDNKIYTGINLFEKGKGNIPFVGNRMIVDLPGSRDVRIEIDPELKVTTYAGLAFTTPCILEIQKDGTLLANKESIVAKDEKGRLWESQRVQSDTEQKIVFLLQDAVLQNQELGSPYQHRAFTIIVPKGWKAVKNPEQGFEIGFTDEKTPRAKWYLHYEVMPEGAGEPPSDPATLHVMSSQFENLVRQQFPRAKKLTPEKRVFPGKTLVHQLYELKENGKTVSRRYVYLFAYNTAYVIQSSVPKGRVDEVTPGIETLFHTFKPRPGAKPIPRTADQSLKNLKSYLPKLVASMPAEWRGTIQDIEFLDGSPKKGDMSLVIVVRWPRKELKSEFASAKETLTLLSRGETETFAVTQTTVDLIKYVGQILGLAVGEVYSLEPEVTCLAVSMVDTKDDKVGIVRIRTKDLMKIIAGNIQPKEAISLYQFE